MRNKDNLERSELEEDAENEVNEFFDGVEKDAEPLSYAAALNYRRLSYLHWELKQIRRLLTDIWEKSL